MTQLNFFVHDIKRMVGKNKLRFLTVWLSRGFWGCFLYRFERSLFLLFRNFYKIIRVPLVPLLNLLQAYSNMDIHYRADVQGGILVLHPSAGCVISGQSKIGKNLTLTGGNIIGVTSMGNEDQFIIGNSCEVGANATILGPIILANNITIGASACVVNDEFIDNSVLIGVPAKRVNKQNE